MGTNPYVDTGRRPRPVTPEPQPIRRIGMPYVDRVVRPPRKLTPEEEYVRRVGQPAEQVAEEQKFIQQFAGQYSRARYEARQSFKLQLQQARKEAWRQWETAAAEQALTPKQRQAFEAEMSSWEAAEKTKFESGLKKWGEKQVGQFETQLKEWRKTWRPPSIAERMLAWKPPAILPFSPKMELKIPVKGGVVVVGVEPFKGVAAGAEAAVAAGAGFVAPIESLIYGVGRLVRVPTPRIPPSPVSAAIGAGVETVIKRKPTIGREAEELRKVEYPAAYIAGGLLAEIGLSYMIGKGVEKVARKAVIEPFKRAWKFSKTEMALIRRGTKITPEGLVYYKGYAARVAKKLTPEIISVPRLPEQLGMEWIKAGRGVDLAWALMQTPKAAGLLVTPEKAAVVPKIAAKYPTLLAWVGAGVVEKLPPMAEPARIRPMPEELKRITGFERYKWRMPVEKELAFVKGKLPTLADLLRETKAEARLISVLAAPAKVKPALKIIPAAIKKVPPTVSSQIFGTGALVGITAAIRPAEVPILKPEVKKLVVRPPAKPKVKERIVPAVIPILKARPEAAEISVVSPILAVQPITAAIAAQKAEAAQVTQLKTVLSQAVFAPPKMRPTALLAPPVMPPRRREELKRRKRLKLRLKKIKRWGLQRYLYPVKGVKGAAEFIFGKS